MKRGTVTMLNHQGFDLWADEYDNSVQQSEQDNTYPFAGYRQVLNTIYRRIRENGGKTVLDIGFGTGTLTKQLYNDGISVTGIDFSPKMIQIAKEKMPNARLIEFDFSAGLPDELFAEKFDSIVCTYAIHHLTREQRNRFLAQLKTILQPNGEILIGDVMFRSKADMERCIVSAGDDWDEDESYIVIDELTADCHMDVQFIACSDCAGVCIIR